MMEGRRMIQISYEENDKTFLATGELISEDDLFVVVNDKYDGITRIGKRFIIKMKEIKDEGIKKIRQFTS